MVLLAMFVTGCVTKTDSRFAREADREKAVKNYVQLATAYIGQDNIERARHHLDRALELSPEHPGALAAMGLVYRSEGEPELAERSFKDALDNDPGYTRGRVYYGAFLYGQRRFEEARDQFLAASRDTEYGERASVFFNLGLAEERVGDLEGAITAYRRAVELSRGDARSLLALSRTLVESGNYQAASRHYSRLTTLMERNQNLRHSPESLYTGIRIAHHFGDQNLASSLGLQLKNNFPNSVEYQQYRVMTSNGQ
ncbi:type IV pilus biogenesis/stability protein PilW [Marinobacter sp. TBZ242]|uniref:Type IV pilus biogenesis/stability protein PilW n=1 Tax=Marinobacter azerbaijanicus TaxID=3050455 RepID=A0ABT7IG07_9GAMM|nr:type IV pilus biogenesis/stability protein PilW [Marinobacter sp. TBZ242]MDL0433104.1 type IV pilus biogenesis/stability protein PilW [Marinobacter sp. TBZ242]